MLRTGAGLVGITVLAAVIAAPIMPGYDEEAVWDVNDFDEEPDPRVVISPLVDIRARLVDQTDSEVFTVQSPVRDYWRITSLDIFDGRIWRSRGAFDQTSGPLDTNLPDGTQFESVTQTFDIQSLARIWLPAAYEPAELLAVPEGIGLEYEPDSGTLIVDRDNSTSDGLEYTLLSAVPQRDLATIQQAGDSLPPEIAERYLDLPPDFSERVSNQAEEIVTSAGAQTPYEKAIALQSFFRDPSLFAYDLEVASGHSADRLEDFLFEVRVGYCEQFSGAFAAMARSIGLPSRVAVGFTPGEYDPVIDAYRVTGKHAHAWPEVWIEDVGWLRFEPTPGRGAPGDEAYTGVPEAQASSLPGNVPTTAAPVEQGVTEDTRELASGAETPTTTTIAAPQGDRAESGVIGGEPGVSNRVLLAWIGGLLVLLSLALLPLVWGMLRARRAEQRAGSSVPRQVGLAWGEARSSLRLLGFPVGDADTPAELVERVEGSNEAAASELRPVADMVVQATFAEEAVDRKSATQARIASQKLAARARSEVGLWKWWGLHANPINVWRDKEGVWGSLKPGG